MTQADETFFAWLDDELAPEQAAEVEARVAADPELQRLAEQHRALGAQLRGAFDTVAAAPVPIGLSERLRQPAQSNLVDFASWRERLRAPSFVPQMPQWAALAATLALGIVTGSLVGGGETARTSPVELAGGHMVAASYLGEALDRQLASQAQDGAVRIGVTFRDSAGTICRSFSETSSSGLACRERDGWRVRGLFAAPEGQGGDYRMAAGADPNLAALIDSTIAGDAFDASQEEAARGHGWR